MPTESRIPENSFRLGAGRYVQGDGVISTVGEECKRLGVSRPVVIGGETALSITRERIAASLDAAGVSADFYTYKALCSDDSIDSLKAGLNADTDAVIGVGGGTLMDTAKYLAVKMGVPVINIPTSSATCAAYTPLSVCYKSDGGKDRTVHHKTEVNVVLADMEVLSTQPPRLFLSGAYDAMAKLYELRQRMLGVEPSECDVGLLSSYHLSAFMLDLIRDNIDGCISDLKEGKSTKRLYDSVYAAIAICGVVSGLARGANQTAIAHKVYEILRADYTEAARPYLHGELVALGIVLQIAYNGDGDPVAFARELREKSIPASLSDIGITDGECAERIYLGLVRSTAMAGTSSNEKKQLRDSIAYLL